MFKLLVVASVALFCYTCADQTLTGWKADILDKHNELRSKVALGQDKPPAKYMAKMVWDEEMAAETQKYADTCPWVFSGDRYNGELITYMSILSTTPTQIVQQWYDAEMWSAQIDQTGFINDNANGNGRFAQIVWATSVKIGCGWKTNCYLGNLLVCHYRPPGNKNRDSEPIYIPGKTCELCDGNCEKGLCDGEMKDQTEVPADSSNASWQAIELLDKHNELRSKIALGEQENMPPAKYMGKMAWDEELAAEAQKYADTCPKGSGDRYNGEIISNVFSGFSNEPHTAIVQKGYDDEVKYAEIDENGFILTGCVYTNGHFTQIVWATSVKLGCGWKSNCDHRTIVAEANMGYCSL